MSVTQRQSLIALLAQVSVAVLALIGATVLCAMDKIDGAALTALYGGAIAAASGAAAATARAAINGGPTVDLVKLSKESPDVAARYAEAQGAADRPLDTHRAS